MSNCFVRLFTNLVLSMFVLSFCFLNPGPIFGATAYDDPRTAEVTLAWDPNDPAPEGYCIYQRKKGESYNYSQPCWKGAATTGTVDNLDWESTYYFVVRAYAVTLESVDSQEVFYVTPPAEPVTYSIAASAVGHGTISPQGILTAVEGTDHTFFVSSDAGWQIADLKVDGVSQGTLSSFTFIGVSSNHKIDVTFTIDTNQNLDPDPNVDKGGELLSGTITINEAIVIDDGQSGTSSNGVWSISGASDPYGSQSLFSKKVGATYSFEAAMSGPYEVSVWWSTWGSRCTSVPVAVYDGAQLLETVYVNQQEDGGQWNFIGLYEFTGQARVIVEVEDSGCSTSVDAVEFAKGGELPSGTITIDDGQSGTSSNGVWSISGASDPYGSQSLFSKKVGATYSFEAAMSGPYEVSVWWSTWGSRCTSVPVAVYDGAQLLETVYVNQQEDGGQWNFIGLYEFTGQARVIVEVEDSGCSTSADAILFSGH